jgi:flagellar biosynthesis protein FlhF
MQIKRFEADDMTEALRMVKREFGDDAVILSAKEMRGGGFFSAFRKKGVEITAAADYPKDEAGEGYDFSKQLSEQLDIESEKDRVSLSSKTHSFIPMNARTEVSEAQIPTPENTKRAEGADDRLPPRKPIQVKTTVAAGVAQVDGRSQRREAGKLAAAPFYRHLSERKIIALVGAHGTGKSTAVAKLARHCCMVEKKKVALISLDRFRIGGNGILEKMSRIMNMPFAVVRDTEGLLAALDEQAHVDVVLIDTPGMVSADASTLDEITRLLQTSKPDETHLVVNATVRQAVLDTWVETFQPMEIDRLFFTHMDEVGTDDSVLELTKTRHLPSSFYTDGVDLFDHLKETTADGLERFRKPTPPTRQRVTDFPGKKKSSDVENAARPQIDDEIVFVANRNSELFHHPDCKSVKRINVENITAFGSIEQAMEEGFKPCRACCNIDVSRKAASGVFGPQSMRAI